MNKEERKNWKEEELWDVIQEFKRQYPNLKLQIDGRTMREILAGEKFIVQYKVRGKGVYQVVEDETSFWNAFHAANAKVRAVNAAIRREQKERQLRLIEKAGVTAADSPVTKIQKLVAAAFTDFDPTA